MKKEIIGSSIKQHFVFILLSEKICSNLTSFVIPYSSYNFKKQEQVLVFVFSKNDKASLKHKFKIFYNALSIYKDI